MSSNRGCVETARETSLGPGLHPVRATVPFGLHRTAHADPHADPPAVRPVSRVLPLAKVRRVVSSDAVVGPYLQGQWPRDHVGLGLSGRGQKDKFTQTSSWWPDEAQRRRVSRGHRRSASWGNAEHLRDPVPIPLSALTQLTSPLWQSEERLDQELERAFKRHSPVQNSKLLEVPDGHRAPVPSLISRGSSQTEPTTHLSSSTSPSASPRRLPDVDFGSAAPSCPSPLLLLPVATSPRPNKSYCFQREPPEGCERVPVCEENTGLYKDQAHLTSCPDPNKVNFTPHGGSAFCPVNLLKPLLPSVDFLFRSLSVSPGSCWAGQGGVCQTPSPAVLMTTGCIGSLDPASSVM